MFVVAFFRLPAVCIAVDGIFVKLGASVIFTIFGGNGVLLRLSSLLLRLFPVYILSAVLVWFLSRPVARWVRMTATATAAIEVVERNYFLFLSVETMKLPPICSTRRTTNVWEFLSCSRQTSSQPLCPIMLKIWPAL